MRPLGITIVGSNYPNALAMAPIGCEMLDREWGQGIGWCWFPCVQFLESGSFLLANLYKLKIVTKGLLSSQNQIAPILRSRIAVFII